MDEVLRLHKTSAAEVVWHGVPLRLFLFGLYRPEALRPYLVASGRLYGRVLTKENIGLWLAGEG